MAEVWPSSNVSLIYQVYNYLERPFLLKKMQSLEMQIPAVACWDIQWVSVPLIPIPLAAVLSLTMQIRIHKHTLTFCPLPSENYEGQKIDDRL